MLACFMDYITLKFTSVRKFFLIAPLCLCGLSCCFGAGTETPKELDFSLLLSCTAFHHLYWSELSV